MSTHWVKKISFISGLLLVIQSLTPGFFALSKAFAQEEPTPTPTEQVTPAPTVEPTSTPTAEPTPEATVSPTPEESATPTPTVEITPLITPEATPTATPTETVTPVPTPTDVVPTATPTEPPHETSPPKEDGQILDGASIIATPTPGVDQLETSETPKPMTPTPTIEIPQTTEGHISATILNDVKASSLDLDSSSIQSSGTLWTDKADYAPTDTALITGTGFLKNHTYSLTISSDDQPATSTTVDITTNESGSFVYAYQLDGTYRPNYKVEIKDGSIVVATTTFTDAPTLGTQILSWNTIGVDSNNPVTDGPHQFVIHARITNPGPETATNVSSTFALTSGTSYISLVGPATQSIGTLTNGQSADVFFQVLITPPSSPNSPSNDVFNKTRDYTITTSYDSNPNVIFPGTLTIEGLNSQNRNSIQSTVVSPATIHVGDTFTVTVQSHTTGGGNFTDISVPMTFNPTIAQLISNSTTYINPAHTETDFYTQNVGGDITSVFTFKALAAGSSNFFWLIYDHSGNSFHYNSDFGSAIVITIQPQLSITKTPATQTVDAGGTVTFNITINNTGNGSGVVSSIIDTLPAGFSYNPGSTSGITTSNPNIVGQQLTWVGPWTINPSGSLALSYQATATQTPGTYTNTVIAKDNNDNTVGPATAQVIVNEVIGTLLVHKVYTDGAAIPVTINVLSDQTPVDSKSTTAGNASFSLTAGQYSAVVAQEPAGYHQQSTTCTDVTVTAGQTTECMITNAHDTGSVVIHKDVQKFNGDAVTDTSNNFAVTLDGSTARTFTDADGGEVTTYSNIVTGPHTIAESVIPSGYSLYSMTNSGNVTVTTDTPTHVYIINRQNAGQISGHKFSDLNRNGIKDQNEPYLSDWTINLTGEANKTTVTDQNGSYSFTNLVTGSYAVSEASQDYWIQTAPQSGSYTVQMTPGGNVSDKDFGNFHELPSVANIKSNITGATVLENSQVQFTIEVQNTGNVTLFNPIVTDTYDSDYLGFVSSILTPTGDPIDPTSHSTAVADSSDYDNDGNTTEMIRTLTWTLPDMPAGQTFTLTLTFTALKFTPEPTTTGNLASTTACISDTNECTLHDSVQAGETSAIVDIDALGSISGTKFIDVDEQGDWDQGESTLGGVTIELYDSFDSWLDDTETNDDGTYNFTGLEPDRYLVCEIVPDGYTQTYPITEEDNCHSFEITEDGESYTGNFGNSLNFINVSISGQKFNDLNGNGVKENGESGLEGWTINLDTNADGNVDATTTTDGNGNYVFDDLGEGTYRVREEQQTGWAQTTTNPSDILAVSGQNVTGVDFGNEYIPPRLEISKTNNAGGDKAPGGNVLYTITVKALDNISYNVKVTDLLSEGFTYRAGSWTATLDGTPISITEPTYASPGVWSIGDMLAGQTAVLTLIADITNDIKPGLFKDVAWAYGCSTDTGCIVTDATSVLSAAVDPGKLADNFVGTHVNVDKNAQNGASINVENTIEGTVLGASTELPATGANSIWIELAGALIIVGFAITIIGFILRRNYA